MPPRTTKDSQHFSNIKEVPSQESLTKKFIYFRVGSLRFGHHGIFGILSLFIVSFSFWKSFRGNVVPVWLACLCVISSLTTSIGSLDLLPQVPSSSHITSWIFPPHREAFRRTIAITGYINFRLVHSWILNKESILFPCLLLVYTIYFFSPLGSNFSNGNTWVFVLPIFFGLMVDCCNQFPIFRMKTISVLDSDWSRVHEWNATKINESYLLLTLLCTLQIAFMFTFAFRGKMSIQNCYWIAALQVGILLFRLA